jgi:hypothetical protein
MFLLSYTIGTLFMEVFLCTPLFASVDDDLPASIVFSLRKILIDLTKDQGQLTLSKVQLAHSVNTVYLPRGSNIVGRQIGPLEWRSPESAVLAAVNKPSDIFSFALLVRQPVTNQNTFLSNG